MEQKERENPDFMLDPKIIELIHAGILTLKEAHRLMSISPQERENELLVWEDLLTRLAHFEVRLHKQLGKLPIEEGGEKKGRSPARIIKILQQIQEENRGFAQQMELHQTQEILQRAYSCNLITIEEVHQIIAGGLYVETSTFLQEKIQDDRTVDLIHIINILLQLLEHDGIDLTTAQALITLTPQHIAGRLQTTRMIAETHKKIKRITKPFEEDQALPISMGSLLAIIDLLNNVISYPSLHQLYICNIKKILGERLRQHVNPIFSTLL